MLRGSVRVLRRTWISRPDPRSYIKGSSVVGGAWCSERSYVNFCHDGFCTVHVRSALMSWHKLFRASLHPTYCIGMPNSESVHFCVVSLNLALQFALSLNTSVSPSTVSYVTSVYVSLQLLLLSSTRIIADIYYNIHIICLVSYQLAVHDCKSGLLLHYCHRCMSVLSIFHRHASYIPDLHILPPLSS